MRPGALPHRRAYGYRDAAVGLGGTNYRLAVSIANRERFLTSRKIRGNAGNPFLQKSLRGPLSFMELDRLGHRQRYLDVA